MSAAGGAAAAAAATSTPDTAQRRTPAQKRKAAAASALAATATDLRDRFDAATRNFTALLLEAMCAGLFSDSVLAKMRADNAFAAENLEATARAAAEAAGPGGGAKVKTPRAARESRFNNYTLFVTLMNSITGVNNMSAIAACWKEMAPGLKQGLVDRLDAIKDAVNQLAKEAGKGGKVDVAGQLAVYERQQRLQPFPWQQQIAPFAGMPNLGGRKKKTPEAAAAPAPEAAAAEHTPEQQQRPAKKQKKSKQQQA